jgi:hypothetical protein
MWVSIGLVSFHLCSIIKQGEAGGQRAAKARFPWQKFMFIERIGTLVDAS